jgi:hypothetical protein
MNPMAARPTPPMPVRPSSPSAGLELLVLELRRRRSRASAPAFSARIHGGGASLLQVELATRWPLLQRSDAPSLPPWAAPPLLRRQRRSHGRGLPSTPTSALLSCPAAVEEERARHAEEQGSASPARFSSWWRLEVDNALWFVESAASMARGQIDALEGVRQHRCGGLFLSNCSTSRARRGGT